MFECALEMIVGILPFLDLLLFINPGVELELGEIFL